MARFREIYAVDLPGQATCYSGARRASVAAAQSTLPSPAPSAVCRLAAEDQLVEIFCGEKHRKRRYRAQTQRLPRIALRGARTETRESKRWVARRDRSCVAHSFLTIPQGGRGGCDRCVEAFVLISRPRPEESANSLSSQQQQHHHDADAGSAEEQKQQQSQESTPSSATKKPGGLAEGPDRLLAEASSTSMGRGGGPSAKAEAFLLIRDPRSRTAVTEEEAEPEPSAIPISYEPLALLTTEIVLEGKGIGQSAVGVLVGSADDARLRLYLQEFSEDNYYEQAFVDCTPPDAGKTCEFLTLLSLASPVMAIAAMVVNSDTNSQQAYNYIALGCQDGTVRVISYRCRLISGGNNKNQYSFMVLSSSTFLVDGPITSVHIILNNDTVHLTVGSLCGFACCFQKEIGDNPKKSFEGPFAIVQDLWDGCLDAEDGVFSTSRFQFGGTIAGAAVAIGTGSGRLLLFEPELQKNECIDKNFGPYNVHPFRLFWHCQLPYPIHSIFAGDVDGDCLTELVVTTRKSLHIFKVDVAGVAEATKKRVEDMFLRLSP